MAVTQPLVVERRQGVVAIPLLPFPTYVHHRTVTTAETETVPAGATRVFVTADADAWLSDGTAAVPAGDVTDGTGSFLLKAGVCRGFFVTPGQTISAISASGTAHISFEYYLTDVSA